MKRTPRCTAALPFFISLLFLSGIRLWSAAPTGSAPPLLLDSLDAVSALAMERNLDYRAAQLDVRKARADLTGPLRLRRSVLLFSADYGTGASAESGSPTWGTSAALTIPLLDQVSFGVSVDQDLSGRFSVSLAPLAHSDSDAQLLIAYRRALARAEAAALSADTEARKAALVWMQAARRLETQETLVEVKRTAYEDEKVRYEEGDATLDEVREALLAWSEARSLLSSLRQKERDAEGALYTAINADPAEAEIVSLGLDDLERELARLSASVDPERGLPEGPGPAGTEAVVSALLDVQSAEKALAAVWPFDPDLSVGASLSLEGKSDPVLSASISLNLSPEDWRAVERGELREELLLAEEAAAQARRASRLSCAQALLAREAAAENTEIRRIELEEARELLAEGEYLYPLGEVSWVEYQELVLSVRGAEDELFAALADEYAALLSLLEFKD